MMRSRLSLAIETGQIDLPDGPLLAFGLGGDDDLSALSKPDTTMVQPFYPDYEALEKRGFAVAIESNCEAKAAFVSLPRSKPLAREWIADACQAAKGGVVIVDGHKTDGVESLLKEVKKRTSVLGSFSKAHGRLFWFEATEFGDWRIGATMNADDFRTMPGVFSADGIDPASKLLADNIPVKFKGSVADLGAGWGYLASRLADRETVKSIHLVEADKRALDCATVNVQSEKAVFHWTDATSFKLHDRVDNVVMNPPFHTERKADPELGKRFISAAARLLKPSGQLFLVANRHLPYETILSERFSHVQEGAGDSRFKTFVAAKPRK